MRILMINVVCGIRSTGRICIDLASALEEQGHEVKIAYGREEVPEQFQKYAVKIGSDLDIKLHGVKARLFDGCGWGSKKATIEFLDWVKEYNPDVIHLHNIHGYYINIEVLFDYLRNCGKKIIWTLHDCWAFTGHSAYCDAANCEKWITGCFECPNMKEYPASYTDHSKENWIKKKHLMNQIPNLTLVTPSEWLAGLVRKSFLAQYPVKVIHNGIDTSKFYPMDNDFRTFYHVGDKFMLLGVSTTWDDMKGYSDYLELANVLGEEYQIVMVGLSKEQIKNLPNNIIGIERTNSIKELSYIYTAADLFLNLSYCENYPTVNLEAVACGTPVLTYNTGGSPESAIEGIVVPRGEIDKVAEAIKRLRDRNKKISVNANSIDAKSTVNDYFEKAYQGGYWIFKNSLGLVGQRVVIGVAAIWDKRKGLEDIVRISRDSNARFIVVGVTNEQRQTLPENIVAYNRTDSIDELRRLYAVADIFLNPTYEDNFPTTNIEALACGTPIITYNTGGSPESARFNGNIVEKGNIDNVVRLIENMGFLNESRNNGKIFDNKDTVKAYIHLLVDK